MNNEIIKNNTSPSSQRYYIQNGGRDLQQNLNKSTNSQTTNTIHERNDLFTFSVCDTPKQIKHNLPVTFQPETQSYLTHKQNTPIASKDGSSLHNMETGDVPQSDENLFKKPNKPITRINSKKNLANKTAVDDYLIQTEKIKDRIIKTLTDSAKFSNNNDMNENLEEKIKVIEYSIHTILALGKENPNLIKKTFISAIDEILEPLQDTETYKHTFIKTAKTVCQIFQTITDAVTNVVEQISSNKYTQTGFQYENCTTHSNSTVSDNATAKENPVNDVTVNKNLNFNNFALQQQLNKPNYQEYQQHQRVRTENHMPVDNTNYSLNTKNQVQHFRENQSQDTAPTVIKNLNLSSAQQIITPCSSINHLAMQYSNGLQHDNRPPKENNQFQQFYNHVPPNITEQQLINQANNNGTINQNNNNGSGINGEFKTKNNQQERGCLQSQMINYTESQKRKNSCLRDGSNVFTAEQQPINDSASLNKQSKIQRYDNMSNTAVNFTENMSGKSIDNRIGSRDVLKQVEEKDIPSNEIIILDDEEPKNGNVHKESLCVIDELSQQNKNYLKNNYTSIFSEIKQATNNIERTYNKYGLLPVSAFQAIVDNLIEYYKTQKFQLQNKVNDKSVQTVMQDQIQHNINNYPTNPTDAVPAMQNTVNNVTFAQNKNFNNSHVQNTRDTGMYRYQPRFQQFHNPQNNSQVIERQRAPQVSYVNQTGYHLNRAQMRLPAEHQSSYVFFSHPNTDYPPQVQQRSVHSGHTNEHYNFEQNNARFTNDPIQIGQTHDYQAQIMQNNIEQQKYYQMELDRNAWAANAGNYPPNWA